MFIAHCRIHSSFHLELNHRALHPEYVRAYDQQLKGSSGEGQAAAAVACSLECDIISTSNRWRRMSLCLNDRKHRLGFFQCHLDFYPMILEQTTNMTDSYLGKVKQVFKMAWEYVFSTSIWSWMYFPQNISEVASYKSHMHRVTCNSESTRSLHVIASRKFAVYVSVYRTYTCLFPSNAEYARHPHRFAVSIDIVVGWGRGFSGFSNLDRQYPNQLLHGGSVFDFSCYHMIPWALSKFVAHDNHFEDGECAL